MCDCWLPKRGRSSPGPKSAANEETKALKEAWAKRYPDKSDLEKVISSETGGKFKRLLISSLQGARQEGKKLDMGLAKQEAQELHQAGEKRW